MEVIITIGFVVLLIVGISVAGRSSLDRGPASNARSTRCDAMAPGADVNRQFERPRDEGDLL